MKTYFILVTAVLVVFVFSDCTSNDPRKSGDKMISSVASKDDKDRQSEVQRGAYLVETMGCHDCHSPKIMSDEGPIPDPARLLSGHLSSELLPSLADASILKSYVLFNMNSTAAVGPWGTSFSANLTPDETGLGNWTYANFEKAMREGKFKGLDGGRMLLPPMPWPGYKHLTDEDMRSIWEYLQTIPPIYNIVPAALPPLS